MRAPALLATGLTLAVFACPAQAHDSCTAQRGAVIGNAVVVDAQVQPASDFAPPSLPGVGAVPISLPRHCRIVAVASPVAGSRIEFELWVPIKGWNERLRMFGNGGYSSRLPHEQMAAALAQGFAVTATDTGHKGDDPDFAIGRRETIADWGHRAVHETIVAAKELVSQVAGRPAAYSYFEGCSTGGHQALMEAQRYPDDFDGIVAGAPGHDRTRLNIAFLWDFVANHREDGSLILGADKLGLLNREVLRQCGSANEQARGYLSDPLACQPDLATLQCQSSDTAQCLSAAEISAAERLYAGPRNPRTGEQIYPGLVPGSELGWPFYWADPARPTQPARANFFRFWAFDDPSWRWQDFDFDISPSLIDPSLRNDIDAIDADLGAFARRGGKLILYHGLMDAVVSPQGTRDYFAAASEVAGPTAATFMRHFEISGMGHCGGGPGLGLADLHGAIAGWVERGHAPNDIGGK